MRHAVKTRIFGLALAVSAGVLFVSAAKAIVL